MIWARVENGNVTWITYNSVQFVWNTYTYPSTWLSNASTEDLAAIGMYVVEEDQSEQPPNTYFGGSTFAVGEDAASVIQTNVWLPFSPEQIAANLASAITQKDVVLKSYYDNKRHAGSLYNGVLVQLDDHYCKLMSYIADDCQDLVTHNSDAWDSNHLAISSNGWLSQDALYLTLAKPSDFLDMFAFVKSECKRILEVSLAHRSDYIVLTSDTAVNEFDISGNWDLPVE